MVSSHKGLQKTGCSKQDALFMTRAESNEHTGWVDTAISDLQGKRSIFKANSSAPWLPFLCLLLSDGMLDWCMVEDRHADSCPKKPRIHVTLALGPNTRNSVTRVHSSWRMSRVKLPGPQSQGHCIIFAEKNALRSLKMPPHSTNGRLHRKVQT